MKGSLYPKLALAGIKKNSKIFLPFILASTGCAMALYIAAAMAYDAHWQEVPGGIYTQTYMQMGVIIIALFSVVLLFYTNSFLIKQRKKEFGLYNVLGMGKRHIVRVVFFETVFTALICIVAGIALGAVFSRLAILLMLKLVGVTTIFSMAFSLNAAVITATAFGCIFLLNLLVNSIKIGRSKTIDLLYGGRVGEREPKSNIPMALLGAVCLIGGYTMALMVEDVVQALLLFFVAVILVIVGTYATIMAGSTVVLKLLKKNKRFYYKANHFISVSGMLYRMKQNAAGIASICILFTMLLVTVSTTGCLYFGVEAIVDDRMNRDVTFASAGDDQESLAYYTQVLERLGESTEFEMTEVYATPYYWMGAEKTGEGYVFSDYNFGKANIEQFGFLTEEAYTALTGETLNLEEGQMLFDHKGGLITGTVLLGGQKLEGVRGEMPQIIRDVCYYENASNIVIVQNEDTIHRILGGEWPPHYIAAFNVANKEQAERAQEMYSTLLDDGPYNAHYVPVTKHEMVFELRNTLGSFLFLGAFLGTLFLMATVLIMYYKQISEGYDDKHRFEIMEKVGMSLKEIRKAIKSQVLMVFFIPILFSIIHVGFATKMIYLILTAFSMTNIGVLLSYTIGSVVLFAILYLVAYAYTARTYYKIVK